MQPENTPNQVPDVTPITVSTRTKSPISLPAAILSGAVIIAVAIILSFGSKNTPTTNDTVPADQPKEITSVPRDVAILRPTDRVRGDASKAEVAIIEYSDSDCPFCERFHVTLEQVYKEFPDKVVWAYRYFPLASLHPNAVTEAIALECVAQIGGNSAFSTYLDKVISLSVSADEKGVETLTSLATAQGIDPILFKGCLSSTSASDRVVADTAEAQKIGAQGTPFSIVVNIKTGKQVIISGAYPIEDVREAIKTVLK